MCVTNFVKRRSEPIARVHQHFSAGTNPSIDTQRLLCNLFPAAVDTSTSYQQFTIPQQARDLAVASARWNGAQQQQQQQQLQPEQPKPKPKRRRKPQKPGKTAKQNDRHFVVHDYHDHARDQDNDDEEEGARRRGGVAVSFPLKLHSVLDQVEADGLGHIVSWQPHGRCFVVHKPKEFVDHVMPHYFRQTKLTSFQRQLNLYGFSRLTRGPDSGGYYHELFLRGKPFLCKRMTRTKVKGTKFKAASSPDQEPDFYPMPPLVPPRQHPQQQVHSDPLPMVAEPSRMAGSPPSNYQNSLVSDGVGLNIYHQYLDSPGASHQQAPPVFEPFGGRPSYFADSALEEAVDELFANDPMGENGGFLDLFNATGDATSAPGSDGLVGDDTQLGYLLEQLLDAE